MVDFKKSIGYLPEILVIFAVLCFSPMLSADETSPSVRENISNSIYETARDLYRGFQYGAWDYSIATIESEMALSLVLSGTIELRRARITFFSDVIIGPLFEEIEFRLLYQNVIGIPASLFPILGYPLFVLSSAVYAGRYYQLGGLAALNIFLADQIFGGFAYKYYSGEPLAYTTGMHIGYDAVRFCILYAPIFLLDQYIRSYMRR